MFCSLRAGLEREREKERERESKMYSLKYMNDRDCCNKEKSQSIFLPGPLTWYFMLVMKTF